jgi:site-specific recombinase XerC
MIMLQATQDIRKVSLWLGHSNLATTEVYGPLKPSSCRIFAKAGSDRRIN